VTLPYERTRAVINVREFLFRLSTPYISNGIKRIPTAVRDEARRLLRHYPNVVDLKYAEQSFSADEADKIMEERDGSR
jgi:transposase InsO family protein